MMLQIATNPHTKEKDQKQLWQILKNAHRELSGELFESGDETLDRVGLGLLKQKLGASRNIIVKN